MQKPVYTMQAHGCDMRNMLGGVKTLHVPKNCVYVTLAACGKPGDANESYEKLIKLIDANHFSIRDPVRYKTTIEELIEMPIHVHHPGATDEFLKTYVDNEYHPWLAWRANEHGEIDSVNEHVLILKSGLYTTHSSISIQSAPTNIRLLTRYNVVTRYNVGLTEIITEDGNITEEIVRFIYKNSIEPSADKIMANLQKYKKSTYSFGDLQRASGTITQSELFKQRPGIYYNTACRAPCDKDPIYDFLFKPHEVRRQQSDIANQGQPTKYFKDAYDDFFVDDSTSWFGLGGKTRKRKPKRKTKRRKN